MRRGLLGMLMALAAAGALLLITGAAAGSRKPEDDKRSSTKVAHHRTSRKRASHHRSSPHRPRTRPSSTAAALDRYSVAEGCFLTYAVSGGEHALPYHGPFRLQATSLGHYLLYGPGQDFLSDNAGAPPSMVAPPGQSTIWLLSGDAVHGFTLTGATGTRIPVRLVATHGCAFYPEGQLDTTGTPFTGAGPLATVSGTVDAHTHVTAFDFLGGSFHCGKPWDQFGIPFALPDCAPYQQGFNGQVESFLDYGAPGHPHDTRGWPTFKDWPSPTDLAEEGDYYTGIKRAWMAGLRLMVTHLVDNEALCDLMTQRRNPCDDMAAVHIQAAHLHELQDYIDAQSGGPGKGFFRIVTDPFQARAVISQGKLAVFEGIELSDLFHCATDSSCSQAQVDRGLAEVRALGVSGFFPVHKFDNAFGGARMDGGEEGVLINGGNHLKFGSFFDVQTCTGPEHDNTQMDVVPAGGLAQLLNGGAGSLLPKGLLGGPVLPTYPPPPHCNARGLTAIGAYLLNRMIQQHFIVEIDHMDVRTGNEALSLLEAHHYSGVVSAHSWDDPGENTRIYNLGGFVTPIAGASPRSFIDQWRATLKIRNPRFYGGTGFGYGADMNGLAEQSQPTSGSPIGYPFRSFDGRVSFGREQWGQRVFDINRDGVANYGMYPDWLQELQTLAGRPLLSDMFHGAEAYLEMWERAYGVPAGSCRPASGRIDAAGAGPLRLGSSASTVLFGAGQPAARPGSVYRYCVNRSGGSLATVFDGSARAALVLSSAAGYSAGALAPGTRMAKLRRSARRVAGGLWVGNPLRGGARYVYVVRGGRVGLVGVAARAVAARTSALQRAVAAPGL